VIITVLVSKMTKEKLVWWQSHP